MSKTVKYRALFSIYASCWAEFEAPLDASVEDLKALAENNVNIPSPCHQCSDEVEIGELNAMHEILQISDGRQVWDDSHGEYCLICEKPMRKDKGVEMGGRKCHHKCRPMPAKG